MTEAPESLPIEEQVKQDPRFSHIIDACPQALAMLCPLVTSLQDNPDNKHAEFWVEYLARFNTLTQMLKTEVVDAELDKEDLPDATIEHNEAISEWLNGVVQRAISVTDIPGYFEKGVGKSYSNRLNRFKNTPEDVDKIPELITSIPWSLMESASRSVSQS